MVYYLYPITIFYLFNIHQKVEMYRFNAKASNLQNNTHLVLADSLAGDLYYVRDTNEPFPDQTPLNSSAQPSNREKKIFKNNFL